VIFKRYCASCHGKEALGDGNVAQYLKVVPANLTQLTKKYGEFPSEKVHAFIDGQTDVRGHGTREMPVWGDVLQSSLAEPDLSSEEGEERAARMIRQLVMYLESIQADG
jgi:mono/diheme cytochrome c family protein